MCKTNERSARKPKSKSPVGRLLNAREGTGHAGEYSEAEAVTLRIGLGYRSATHWSLGIIVEQREAYDFKISPS